MQEKLENSHISNINFFPNHIQNISGYRRLKFLDVNRNNNVSCSQIFFPVLHPKLLMLESGFMGLKLLRYGAKVSLVLFPLL